MTTTDRFTEAAAKFVARCKAEGWQYSVKIANGQATVTISQTFTANDRDAYVRCDGSAYSVLAICPQTKPGSVWGTDGGSVGGHAGLTGGYYRLNKSGVAVKFARALATM